MAKDFLIGFIASIAFLVLGATAICVIWCSVAFFIDCFKNPTVAYTFLGIVCFGVVGGVSMMLAAQDARAGRCGPR